MICGFERQKLLDKNNKQESTNIFTYESFFVNQLQTQVFTFIASTMVFLVGICHVYLSLKDKNFKTIVSIIALHKLSLTNAQPDNNFSTKYVYHDQWITFAINV